MVTTPLFWEGKRVLVTGHTGFKGSWLSIWLQQLGAEVIGLSLEPPTNPSLYRVANVADEISSLHGDIRDLETLKSVFKQYQPEIVFHLAAQSLVRHSYKQPVETYATNVMGTLHVLEGMRSVDSVRSAVMITTDKCYENKEWEWGYRENESMGGYDPYSSSKGCAELLIASYRESYYPAAQYQGHRMSIASVRAGNVIGGGDWAEDRLIPDVIRAFKNGGKVLIRNPNAIRPWQHVLEPLSGYINLAEQLFNNGIYYAGAWNFGPQEDDVRPVEWIVRKMTEQWDGNAGWIVDCRDHPHEANYLKLDCSKAHSRLDWWPKWNIEKALEQIILWHIAEMRGDDMKQVCLQQIKEYNL